MIRKPKKTIDLDHAAATPLDRRVFDAMRPFFSSAYGNPSSLHHKGLEAKKAIEASRKIIAETIGARPQEIVFTSGGTESCNLAILGAAQGGRRAAGQIVTTAIEHHAVLEPVKILQKWGWKAVFLPVDSEGFVDVDDMRKAIKQDTALVSVMYANNEIGTVEPIAKIGRLIREQNLKRKARKLPEIIFHTDACQAAGRLDLNVNRLQVDLMSVSAGKIHGPKGVGFLYIRRGTSVGPIIHGGGQERGLRSGTENVAGIAGMARALELAEGHREQVGKRLAGLRDYLFLQVKKNLPKVILNGPNIKKLRNDDRRLPHNINITIPGVEGEALLLYLDTYGICVSTGSACATGSAYSSHILSAIGRNEKQAKESIRITLNENTKKADIDYLVKIMKKAIPLILNGR